MFTRFTSLVVVGLLAVPAFGQDIAAKKPDPTAAILSKLREPWKGPAAVESVEELVAVLTEKLDLNVVVNEEVFKRNGIDSVLSHRVKLPRGKGLSTRTVLTTALAPMRATFLVRKDHIELLPFFDAAKSLKVPVAENEGAVVGLAEPLVSVVAREKPLNDLLAELAEDFDLNVVVSPQAGDSRMAFVTARLLNVPADKALDTIATTADLRVVRKGDVFLITSRDHANELFSEKLEKEKQKIEVEMLRKSPPPVPPPGGTIPPTEIPTAPPPVEKK